MEKFLLSSNSYELVKKIDLTEMADMIIFNDEDCSIETSDADLLLTIINENIATFGMDEKYVPTKYGRELYQLHDEIYYQ